MAGRIRNHEDAGDAEISDFRDFKSDRSEEGAAVLYQDLSDRNCGDVVINLSRRNTGVSTRTRADVHTDADQKDADQERYGSAPGHKFLVRQF